jgi:carbon-monoxide dehydrogenase small subunit
MTIERKIRVRVNGVTYERTVEARRLLADFLRDELGLTGTHLGCEHGVCGACTIVVNGEAVRSCLLFALQADDAEILTVEGLAEGDRLHPLQQSFWEHHGLQCGFCTPGFLMSLVCFLRDNAHPTEEEIRVALSGNLCRCTGYQNIVRAVKAAAERLAAPGASPVVTQG